MDKSTKKLASISKSIFPQCSCNYWIYYATDCYRLLRSPLPGSPVSSVRRNSVELTWTRRTDPALLVKEAKAGEYSKTGCCIIGWNSWRFVTLLQVHVCSCWMLFAAVAAVVVTWKLLQIDVSTYPKSMKPLKSSWIWLRNGSVSKPWTPGEHQNSW